MLWVPEPGQIVSLDTGDSLVVYLLDDGTATVTILIQTTEQELAPFVDLAEPVIASLEFRAGP